MATIEIKRTHKLAFKQARRIVNNIAEDIKDEFNLEYYWNGNELKFGGSGTNGSIQIHKSSVQVLVDLNWLLRKTIKGKIEKKINGFLDDKFLS